MKTPVLNELHEREGARIVEFAGWRMPVSYTSIIKEALAVRTAVGLFDVTHMGRFQLSGTGAMETLQYITTNDVSKLQDFQGQYTLICNETGGVVDDTIIYRKDAGTFFMVANASNADKDAEWIRRHIKGETTLEVFTEDTALFALQGPDSIKVMSELGLPEAAGIGRFRLGYFTLEGKDLAVARTGYTGEDGFEIACHRDHAEELWNRILEAGESYSIARCGLGARDVLRIEAGYPLYGHEIDEHISPIDAGLMRFVKMEKPDFIGKDAISQALTAPPRFTLTGLVMEGRAVPRQGDLVAKEGMEIGSVTSGTWSPVLGKGIGMAFLLPEAAGISEAIEVLSKGKAERGKTAALPIYTRGT